MTSEIDPFSTHTGPFFMRIKKSVRFLLYSMGRRENRAIFLIGKDRDKCDSE